MTHVGQRRYRAGVVATHAFDTAGKNMVRVTTQSSTNFPVGGLPTAGLQSPAASSQTRRISLAPSADGSIRLRRQ